MSDLVGASATDTCAVEGGDTAVAVGSGQVRVLSTPTLLAWLEATTVQALRARLAEGMTTVGHRVNLRHLHPTPVGQQVRLSACVVSAHERSVTFEVTAQSPAGQTVALGTVERVVVDKERFESRAGVPSDFAGEATS